MQPAAENPALSIPVNRDNRGTHLGFSRGSGSFRPKPTGLFSASSRVSSWNSASTLPCRENKSEPQMLRIPARTGFVSSQFHLQILRAITLFSRHQLQCLWLHSHEKLRPGQKWTGLQPRHCTVTHYLIPGFSAASRTGTEQNSPWGTNSGPWAGPSPVSLSWDSWHLDKLLLLSWLVDVELRASCFAPCTEHWCVGSSE